MRRKTEVIASGVSVKLNVPKTPIMPKRCASCPWRKGSKAEFLKAEITISALSQASRICHSTGGNDSIIPKIKNLHKEPWLCRGARDEQLNMFAKLGFLKEPTDACWAAKCRELGIA